VELNTIAKSLLWSLLVVALMAVGALMVIDQAEDSRQNLVVVGTVPEFSFVDQDEVAFTQADLKNKISIIDFIFTNCQGPCPLMAEQMIGLYEFYEDSEQVQFVSVSVDPERDSPAILKEYALLQGVSDKRWKFLHAPLVQVQDLLEKGFYLAADNLPHGHSTKFILVDQDAQIRGYFDFEDPLSLEILKQNVQDLARADG